MSKSKPSASGPMSYVRAPSSCGETAPTEKLESTSLRDPISISSRDSRSAVSSTACSRNGVYLPCWSRTAERFSYTTLRHSDGTPTPLRRHSPRDVLEPHKGGPADRCRV